MKRYTFLSTFILTALLASCAPNLAAQPVDAQEPENPIRAALPGSSATADSSRTEVLPHDPPANCPVTAETDPRFVPPAPYDSLGFEGEFWYGANSLWTVVREDGIWEGLPLTHNGYTQKVLWWRDGYIWTEEPEPDLIVTGERLDGPAPELASSKATNAYAEDIGSAMLVGVDIPTSGCWKITGKYADTELSFVVWVAP